MRLTSPSKAPDLSLLDIYGAPVPVGMGQSKTLLCFFRDAACPFCAYRIVELTRSYPSLAALGLEIVAVFTSAPEAVSRFVTHQRRPFRVVADPTARAHELFRIERSLVRKIKGILTRIPTLLKGLRLVGLAGLNTTNLMPAEFLIDETGNIEEAYYGRDPGDRLPIEKIEMFLAKSIVRKARAAAHGPSGMERARKLTSSATT